MSVLELKKDLKNKKPILGEDVTLKKLKSGELEKIYLSSNIREDVEKDLVYYAKLAKVKIIKLKEDSSQLGIICKKPFNVNIISF